MARMTDSIRNSRSKAKKAVIDKARVKRPRRDESTDSNLRSLRYSGTRIGEFRGGGSMVPKKGMPRVSYKTDKDGNVSSWRIGNGPEQYTHTNAKKPTEKNLSSYVKNYYKKNSK